MKKTFYILLFLSTLTNAQIGLNKDSLKQILSSGQSDSVKVKTIEILLVPFYTADLIESKKQFETGINLCQKNHFLEDQITLNIQWSQICEMSGEYEQAVECQKAATEIALESGNTKKLKEILKHILHYRTETLKALRDKERITKQRNLSYLISSIIIVILLIVIVVVSRKHLKQQKRNNEILTKQKELIENQKQIVEEKQKEILDSIHYASRIQRALITSEKYIAKELRRLMKNG